MSEPGRPDCLDRDLPAGERLLLRQRDRRALRAAGHGRGAYRRRQQGGPAPQAPAGAPRRLPGDRPDRRDPHGHARGSSGRLPGQALHRARDRGVGRVALDQPDARRHLRRGLRHRLRRADPGRARPQGAGAALHRHGRAAGGAAARLPLPRLALGGRPPDALDPRDPRHLPHLRPRPPRVRLDRGDPPPGGRGQRAGRHRRHRDGDHPQRHPVLGDAGQEGDGARGRRSSRSTSTRRLARSSA